MAAEGVRRWEVVGGRDKGGILVREGQDIGSPSLGRLSCGAVVEERQLAGDRLRYALVAGRGLGDPAAGWVSIRLKDGKELLTPMESSLPASSAQLAARIGCQKVRVLAIHGTPANSNVIKFQTSQLRRLLGKDVEWFFPDAPMPWAPRPGSTFPNDQERSEFELRIAQGRPFVQWYNTAVHGKTGSDDVWEHVAECTEFLRQYISREAPIDVVLAFSQGSSMVSLLIEQLRKARQAPPWRLNVLFCGGNIDDATNQLQEQSLVPTLYVSGGASDPFDGFIAAKVQAMYAQLRILRHGDGHNFPSTPPRAGEIYDEVAGEIRRHCGLPTPAVTPPAPERTAGVTGNDVGLPHGLWTVDYIGNARGVCQACNACEYYRWNPNKLRPEQGDDGDATITEWFLNDYDALRCQACRCKFSDHRSLGGVNKPAGFYPGLSEEDANALISQ